MKCPQKPTMKRKFKAAALVSRQYTLQDAQSMKQGSSKRLNVEGVVLV
jgi:hypothetical protein